MDMKIEKLIEKFFNTMRYDEYKTNFHRFEIFTIFRICHKKNISQ